MADAFRYPFLRSNNYLGAYRLLPSTKAALPVMEDMQFQAASGGVDATANGTTLSYLFSFIAGGASGGAGAVDATANGATVTYSESLLTGAASASSQAGGATASQSLSLVTGQASAASQATGQTLSGAYSLIAGGASGGVSATATGATFTYSHSLIEGAATGEVNQPDSLGYIDGLKRKPDKEKSKLEDIIEAAFERVVSPGEAPTVKEARQVVRSVRQEVRLDGVEASISLIRKLVNEYAAYLKKRADDDEEDVIAFMLMG